MRLNPALSEISGFSSRYFKTFWFLKYLGSTFEESKINSFLKSVDSISLYVKFKALKFTFFDTLPIKDWGIKSNNSFDPAFFKFSLIIF